MKKEFFEMKAGGVIRILPSGSTVDPAPMYSYDDNRIYIYPLSLIRYNKVKSKTEIRIMKIKKAFNI